MKEYELAKANTVTEYDNTKKSVIQNEEVFGTSDQEKIDYIIKNYY